jgi:hypothetical protein
LGRHGREDRDRFAGGELALEHSSRFG